MGEINPHHIGELLQEFGIAGKLKTLGQVGLELVFLPDAVNRVFAYPLRASQRTGAPMVEPAVLITDIPSAQRTNESPSRNWKKSSAISRWSRQKMVRGTGFEPVTSRV